LLQFKCERQKYNRSISVNLLGEDGIVDVVVLLVDLGGDVDEVAVLVVVVSAKR